MPNATLAEFTSAREPTGPPPVSLLKVLRGYKSDPIERWTRVREEHGEVAHYRYGFSNTFLVTGAEGAKRVLQDNAPNYTKEHSSYQMVRRVFGNGLLTSEGSFWLRQRRLAQPAFHRQRIAAMAVRMATAAAELAQEWESKRGAPVNMLREMSRLTLRIVGEALFGAGIAELAAPVGASWDVLNGQLTERHRNMRLIPPILPTKYDRDFRTARATLFRVVDEIIALKRKAGGEGDDLISMFMAARDEDTGESMNDQQLRDEVVTMLLAGHETTAITLSWTWSLLDEHRDVAAKLHAELDRVLGGRMPTAADYPQLAYTRAVIDESLRLRSPVYILNRHIEENDVICGHRVYGGASIVIAVPVLHRHPAYWDRPNEFLPERFLDPEAEKKRPRFAFIPFSAGPRQCIGNTFALMEATLILATLAQRFAPRLAPGYIPAPEYLVLSRPKDGAPMTVEGREVPRLSHVG